MSTNTKIPSSSSLIRIPESNNPRNFEAKPSQWSTGRALFLAAVTGGLAYAVAIMRERDGKGNMIRDYADPDKFEVPIYANIGEMESVSFCFVVIVLE